MRGHIKKRGNKYSIVVDVGRDHRNKRIQKWFSGYDRKKDAEKDLPRIISAIEKGYKEPVDMTVEEYLNGWLERKRKSVALGTYIHYESYTRNHLIPGIGRWKVKKIDNDIIDSYVEDELKEKDLSQRTKKHIFRILASTMSSGRKYGIQDNIMEGIEAPRVERHEIEYWTLEEMHTFLSWLRSENHSIPFYIALSTGMRKGEVLGLRWSRVDFDNKTIAVTHQLKQKMGKKEDKVWVLSPQLKTITSHRTIKIDDETIELLKEHKKKQERDRLECGPDYIDKDMVCAISTGDYMRPTYLRTVFNRTIGRSGVKKISFHGLRHTHATLLLTDGVHPKVVQERLGHASIHVTLDTYSHVVPGIQEVAALSIGKSLYSKKEPIKNNVFSIVKNNK